MVGKIIIICFMIIGAILVYGASKIGEILNFSEDKEKNMLIIKVTGFIVVVISAIIAFIRV